MLHCRNLIVIEIVLIVEQETPSLYLWQNSNGTTKQLGASLLDNQLINAFRRNPCPPVKGFIGKLEKFFVAFIRLQQITVFALHPPKLNKELFRYL